MRHPVRNVDVDAIYARRRNLSNSFHVGFAPLSSVRTDPYILIAFGNPECRSAAENCRFACNLALKPIWMVLGQRMRRLIGIRRDALQSGDVNESVIAGLVRLVGDRAN